PPQDEAGKAQPLNKPPTKFHSPRALYRPLLGTFKIRDPPKKASVFPRPPDPKLRLEQPFFRCAPKSFPTLPLLPPKSSSLLLHPESCSLPTTPSIGRRGEGGHYRLQRSSTLQLWRAQSEIPPPAHDPTAVFPSPLRLRSTAGDRHRAAARGTD